MPPATDHTVRVHKVLLAVVVVASVALGAWMVLASAIGPAPQIVDTAAPANVPAPDFTWHTVPLPGGSSTPVGVIRAPGGAGRDRPAILLVTGTEGLNTDYPQFARELAAEGYDVAVGCWFRTEGATGAGEAGVACPDAPDFKGVSDAAVADLDALVLGARAALGDPQSLSLVGFSRGGGIAMLRAADGARDPVVSISGMVEGTTAWGNLPDEVNVVERGVGRSRTGAAAPRRGRSARADHPGRAPGRRAAGRRRRRADALVPERWSRPRAGSRRSRRHGPANRGMAADDDQPCSFSSSSWLRTCGFAWPFVAFISSPMKKPRFFLRALSSPAR